MSELRRLLRSAIARIFSRYLIGSVVSAGVSEATLMVAYGLGLLGPHEASVAAWVTGAIVNYLLNRWAWRVRGKPKPLRELLPYWAAAVASLVVSTWATGVADRLGSQLFGEGTARTVFVGAVFLGVYGVLFVGKFVLFHYFVFAGTEGDAGEETGGRRRSRSQVPSTTRE
jgi:putative flippase GtrA